MELIKIKDKENLLHRLDIRKKLNEEKIIFMVDKKGNWVIGASDEDEKISSYFLLFFNSTKIKNDYINKNFEPAASTKIVLKNIEQLSQKDFLNSLENRINKEGL